MLHTICGTMPHTCPSPSMPGHWLGPHWPPTTKSRRYLSGRTGSPPPRYWKLGDLSNVEGPWKVFGTFCKIIGHGNCAMGNGPLRFVVTIPRGQCASVRDQAGTRGRRILLAGLGGVGLGMAANQGTHIPRALPCPLAPFLPLPISL